MGEMEVPMRAFVPPLANRKMGARRPSLPPGATWRIGCEAWVMRTRRTSLSAAKNTDGLRVLHDRERMQSRHYGRQEATQDARDGGSWIALGGLPCKRVDIPTKGVPSRDCWPLPGWKPALHGVLQWVGQRQGNDLSVRHGARAAAPGHCDAHDRSPGRRRSAAAARTNGRA